MNDLLGLFHDHRGIISIYSMGSKELINILKRLLEPIFVHKIIPFAHFDAKFPSFGMPFKLVIDREHLKARIYNLI